MRELLLVFNWKAHTFLKNVFTINWQNVSKNLASVLIFGGFAVAVFFLSRTVTSYLLQQYHIGQFLFHRFLSMVLYVFFITVNLGNMIVSFATLYRSQEVGFLMAMPISHAKIFLIKFVDNFFYSSSTLTLVGLAVLLGYGSVFDLPWYFYFFTIFLVIIPFMLIAGILAVMVLMMLIRVASKIGVRWLLGLIITAYLGVVYAYFKITNPMQLVSEVMKHYPDVNEYFGYLDPPLVQYLPNHWVTEFLYWTVNGEYARALPFLIILLLTMIGLVMLAGLMAHRYYYKSWLAATDAQAMRASKGKGLRLRFMEFGRPTWLKPQTQALIKRDFWLFFREPSQWLHLMLIVLLMVIFVYSVSSLELKLSQPFMQAVSFLVIFLFDGFLIASITLRFVFPAVSLESDSFWAVRSSPLSMTRLYWHKFLFAFAVIFVSAEVLSILSVWIVRRDFLLVRVASICTTFLVLALTSLNMGAGTYFASFKEKNPIRVASSQGASLTFLLSLIFLAMVAGVLLFPLHVYFDTIFRKGIVFESWAYVPVGAIATFSILIFVITSKVGLKSIRRDL